VLYNLSDKPTNQSVITLFFAEALKWSVTASLRQVIDSKTCMGKTADSRSFFSKGSHTSRATAIEKKW